MLTACYLCLAPTCIGVGHLFLVMTHKELRQSCTDAVVIETGEHIEAPIGSILDMGGGVRAKHKIYVEVPDWDGDNNSGSNSLRQCYMTAVEEAVQSGFLSVTIPLLIPVLPEGKKHIRRFWRWILPYLP